MPMYPNKTLIKAETMSVYLSVYCRVNNYWLLCLFLNAKKAQILKFPFSKTLGELIYSV